MSSALAPGMVGRPERMDRTSHRVLNTSQRRIPAPVGDGVDTNLHAPRQGAQPATPIAPAAAPNHLPLPYPYVRAGAYFILKATTTAACTVIANQACIAAAAPPLLQLGFCGFSALLGATAVKIVESSPQLQHFETKCRRKISNLPDGLKYAGILGAGLLGIGMLAPYASQIPQLRTCTPFVRGCSVAIIGLLFGAYAVCFPQHMLFAATGSMLVNYLAAINGLTPFDRALGTLAGSVIGSFAARRVQGFNHTLQLATSASIAASLVVAAMLTYNPMLIFELTARWQD